MVAGVFFPPDDDLDAIGRALTGKTVDTAILGKNTIGDDALTIKFTDGTELRVKANFVYSGDDDIDNVTLETQIENQLDVSLFPKPDDGE